MSDEELKAAMARHPSSQKKVPPRPKPTLVVRYRCCWHCGDNPLHAAHIHAVPCNEPEECEGKEVFLD